MSKSGEKKQSFIMKLIDDDNNYSTVNFFLVAMTIVGIIMLIIPMVGMCIDIWFNHTITINLSDLGSYVLAVSGIFGVAGISNAWVEYSWNRYGQNIYKDNQSTQYPQE
jgi:hypothetical protein